MSVIIDMIESVAIATIAAKRDEREALRRYDAHRADLLASGWDRERLVLCAGSITYRPPAERAGGVDSAELRRRLDRATAALGRLAVACPGHAVDLLAVQRLLAVPVKPAVSVAETLAITVSP